MMGFIDNREIGELGRIKRWFLVSGGTLVYLSGFRKKTGPATPLGASGHQNRFPVSIKKIRIFIILIISRIIRMFERIENPIGSESVLPAW